MWKLYIKMQKGGTEAEQILWVNQSKEWNRQNENQARDDT